MRFVQMAEIPAGNLLRIETYVEKALAYGLVDDIADDLDDHYPAVRFFLGNRFEEGKVVAVVEDAALPQP